MKLSRKSLLLWLSATLVLVLAGGWFLLAANSPLNRDSTIRATLEWAQLAPCPVPASALRLETSGSPFTREYRVSFSADPQTIQQWLDASPGTKGLLPQTDTDGWFYYMIKPSGGAGYAELRLSPDKKQVKIRAYWS